MQIAPLNTQTVIDTYHQSIGINSKDPRQEFLLLFLKETMKTNDLFKKDDDDGLFSQSQLSLQKDLIDQAMLRQLVTDDKYGLFKKFYSSEEHTKN